MVKRSRQPHRKQTKSELRRKKKASHTAFQHQADFVHPSIKAAWDKRRTLEQNYVALGLAADPNDRRQRQRQSERLAAVDIDASEEQLRVSLLTRKRKREGLEEREGEMEEGERDEGEEGEEEDDGGATAVSSTPAARQLHEELREVQKLGDKARPYQVKVSAAAPHWTLPNSLLGRPFLTLVSPSPLCFPLLCLVDVAERAASSAASDRQVRRRR